MQQGSVKVKASLADLTQEWKQAKQHLADAQERLLDIESAIYEMVQGDLPDKGTFTTETGMKIVTGFSEDWDQEAVNAAYQQWPADRPFPFKGIWKADGKAVSYMRDHEPRLYALIGPALTLKPRKPAFSVKE